MAERVVIDASIAVALLRQEPAGPRLRAALRLWTRQGCELLVPSHFWVEVVNVLVRRHHRAGPEVLEGLTILDGLGLQTVQLDRPTLLLALVPMSQAGLSAYDALYLAVAISSEARLATLDRRLAKAAGGLAVLVDRSQPRRLAERGIEYAPTARREPSWAKSAIVGAQIAELRRQVLASR